ncbi:hypothetical protein SDC9_32054 [bioreactor metagenome]|uniref:Uncharacterized protein n=1 Tax=bioreactor metagenome TaxID=1076179 RepID=A0A644V404_9ZZZZ
MKVPGALAAHRGTGSLLDPGVLEPVVQADARGDEILDRAAADRRHPHVEKPGVRHVIDEDLLHRVIGGLAFGRIDRARALVEQRIDLRVRIPLDVVPGRALLDVARHIAARHPKRRIAILIQIGRRQVVIPIRQMLVPARDIGRDDLDRDPHIGEVLLDDLGKAHPGLAIGHRDKLQHLALVARGLDQCLRLLRIVGPGLQIGVVIARRTGEGPVRDLAETVEQRLADELTVERIQDRLTEFLACGRALTVVQPHPGLRAEELPAGLGDAGIGQRLHPVDVEILDRAGGQDVDLSGLVGHRARGGVGDHVPVDLVEIGLALVPVLGVLHQLDIRALDPFGELERAGADRRVVGRVGGEIGAFVDVLRHDRHRADLETVQERAEGRFQPEHHGLGVRRGDAFDVIENGAEPRMGLAQEHVGAEHHIVGRERLPVVPPHPVLKVEGIGQAVGRHLPAFRQRGHRVQLGVVAQQPFVDVARHLLGRGVLHQAEHQAWRFGLDDDIRPPTRDRISQRWRHGQETRDDGRQNALHENSPLSFGHILVPSRCEVASAPEDGEIIRPSPSAAQIGLSYRCDKRDAPRHRSVMSSPCPASRLCHVQGDVAG